MFSTTIAAIATAMGGAISIIRISGPKALEIALKVWRPLTDNSEVKPRYATLGNCYDDTTLLEQALLIYMPNPHSYTGEDVVELQCHGGIYGSRALLAALLRNGAHSADAGEFTKRAFVNGKMDLTQAEAVMDMIEAHSEMALHTAARQLEGRVGESISELYIDTQKALAEVEVRMDFVDEELDFDDHAKIKNNFATIKARLLKLLQTKREGEVLRNGIKIVIAGAPNAGKSTLMNLFLGRDRAIVTDIPGTTRDVLEEFAHVRSIPVRLFDTAGIRETVDQVEQIGVNRSFSHLKEAEIILWLIDSSATDIEAPPADIINSPRTIFIKNKCDLATATKIDFLTKKKSINISALEGSGYNELLDAIEKLTWKYPHVEDIDIAINDRQANAIEEALESLESGYRCIDQDEWELVALALRGTMHAVGLVTGESVEPDILEHIFSGFCIGK